MSRDDAARTIAGNGALVEAVNVSHRFQRDGHELVVLRDVSLADHPGEVVGGARARRAAASRRCCAS